MEVWMIWIFMLSARGGDRACCWSSTFRRAEASSRRMDIHSGDLRLLCWNMRRRGVERRREVY